MPLRVATLNLWNLSGPWGVRLGLIRREIERLRPDLLGLQEVMRVAHGDPDASDLDPAPAPASGPATARSAERAPDQAALVAEGFGYHVAYGSATRYDGGVVLGNALLSRFPVLEHRMIRLPGAEETRERRSLLYALVETPYGLLPVFVTHLSWKLHHGAFRLRQARFLVDRVFEIAPVDESRLPPVVMGDFNAEPHSDEIRYMTGHATVEGRSVYFADAWVCGSDGGPGHTFDRRNRFAALAHEPPRRIDYVFVRGPDRKLRGEPLETRLAFATPEPHPEGEMWPSDHFGVVSDLAVAPRSR